MTGNDPEPDDVIGSDHPRASFGDFAESAAARLLAAARLVTGGGTSPPAGDLVAENLLAGVLARAGRRWWWLTRGGRDPERPVLRMLIRAAGRPGAPDLDRLERMAAATVGRPGEPGAWSAADLLAAVDRQRAQQGRRRLVACGVAGVLVVAAAAWPVSSALLSSHPPRGSHLAITASRSPLISAVSGLGSVPGPSPNGPPVPREAGTILRECADNNDGVLSFHWQEDSLRAGPVWFVDGKTSGAWPVSHRLAHGRMAARAGIVAIRSSQRAVVRVAGPARTRFHFLPGFRGDDIYSMRDGQPGMTLGGCPGVFTMFWQGYISTSSCVPLVVRPLPHGRPVHVTLSATGAPCPRR
jgi:hypothetical protein